MGARSSHRAGTLRLAMAPDRGGQSDAPSGWYLASDVAVLVGVSAHRIGQWARHGYIRASREPGPPEVFSFWDVAEALLVRELVEEHKVPPAEVRMTVMNAGAQYGNWPLQNAPIGVYKGEKRSRVGLRTGSGTYDIGQRHSRGGQRFLELGQELRRLEGLLRRGGWVIQLHPEIERIEVDPDKLSGAPSIAGRRILATQVAQIAREKGGRRALRDDYDLSREEINDAVAWWAAVSELQAAA